VCKADNLPPFCAVVTKSGNLNFLELSGPVQACNGTDLPLPLLYEGVISIEKYSEKLKGSKLKIMQKNWRNTRVSGTLCCIVRKSEFFGKCSFCKKRKASSAFNFAQFCMPLKCSDKNRVKCSDKNSVKCSDKNGVKCSDKNGVKCSDKKRVKSKLFYSLNVTVLIFTFLEDQIYRTWSVHAL